MGSNIENLFFENGYIIWLSKFIDEHVDFNTDDVRSLFKNIEQSDKDNIKKLTEFYDALNDYASDNSFLPNFYLLGNYFKMKYNDKKFIIGKSSVDGQINYYCKKGLPFGKYIEYYDMKNYYLNETKNKLR